MDVWPFETYGAPIQIQSPTFSRAERELLKAVYRATQEVPSASTRELAVRLRLSPGSVTAGVKRLAERDLVAHQPYRGVELTATGAVIAVSIVRRHRIVECFLVDMLGYAWKEADRLATTFEHQLPAEVAEAIYNRLGRPTHCPHGFPVPGETTTQVAVTRRLTDLAVGERATVALSGDTDVDVLDFLESLGVRPGVTVEVRNRHPFDGPVDLRVDGSDHTVGDFLARRIYVVGHEASTPVRDAAADTDVSSPNEDVLMKRSS